MCQNFIAILMVLESKVPNILKRCKFSSALAFQLKVGWHPWLTALSVSTSNCKLVSALTADAVNRPLPLSPAESTAKFDADIVEVCLSWIRHGERVK